MAWVYTLQLTRVKEPDTIHTDWENNIPGNAVVKNDHGGVCVTSRIDGVRAVIVSQRNNPEYEEMETLDYVRSITESKEIPNRGDSEFDPPIELGQGITLLE